LFKEKGAGAIRKIPGRGDFLSEKIRTGERSIEVWRSPFFDWMDVEMLAREEVSIIS
jgi:hypothetical protein